MTYPTAKSAWNMMRLRYRQTYGHDLPRKFTLHSLRHTAATWAANHASYAQMLKKFGWAQGSRMPGVYQDLAAADLTKLKADMAGEKYSDKRAKAPHALESRICPNAKCGWENSGAANFCERCGAIMDLAKRLEIKEAARGDPELDAAMQEVVERLSPMIQAEVAKVLAKARTKRGASGSSKDS
jgi:hypothetical protein